MQNGYYFLSGLLVLCCALRVIVVFVQEGTKGYSGFESIDGRGKLTPRDDIH